MGSVLIVKGFWGRTVVSLVSFVMGFFFSSGCPAPLFFALRDEVIA